MQSTFLIRLLWATLLTSLLPVASAFAAVLPVTSLADNGSGSLRELIQTAASGDTLDMQSLVGSITLDSMLVVDKNLTWLGPGASMLTLDGQGLTRHLEVTDDDTLFVSGLRFWNGNALNYPFPGGGSISNQGFMEARSCLWEENFAGYGGAIVNSRSQEFATLVLINCAFIANSAAPGQPNPGNPGPPRAGGAIYGDGQFSGADSASSIVRATNCTFSHNKADEMGGAIFMVGDIAGGTEFRTFHCTIAANEAPEGAGIANFKFAGIVLQNSIVAQNIGLIDPDINGGIASAGHNVIGEVGMSTFTPDPTDSVNQEAVVGALAIPPVGFPYHPLLCGSAAIDGGTAEGLTADQNGRAYIGDPDIGAFERDATLDARVLNVAESGYGSLRASLELACPGEVVDLGNIAGTIRLKTPLVLTQDVMIEGNASRSLIISGEDSLRIVEVEAGVEAEMTWLTLRNARPDLYGGGAIQNRGNLTLRQITLSGNTAEAGGAIANYSDQGPAHVSAINCTFGNNTAEWLDGGAIDNRSFTDSATLNLLHCTLADNSAAKKGGAIHSTGDLAGVTIQSSIMAQNTGESGPDLFGDYSSGGTNLIGSDTGYNLADGSGELTGVDPQLDVLGLYGGPTETFRLKSSSPAIDAAANQSNLPLDQRGESRTFNGSPDIGAYEYDPATSVAEELMAASFGLSPNPAVRDIQLSFGENAQGIWAIRLFDLMGRQLWYTELRAAGGDKISQQLPELATGVYLVQGQNGALRHSLRLKIE